MARMKPFALVAATVLAGSAPLVAAQSVCSSDGMTTPTALFERFLSADCEACWADAATAAPPTGSAAVVLDWIVPSPAGDEAALSAAATRDALARLEALGRRPPAATDVHIATVQAAPRARVRVAQGMAFNDYLGTGIAWRPAAHSTPRAPGAVDFYLLLVESVPAGADGTPVARNLVRNMLQGTWKKRNKLSKREQSQWMEQRPMRVPDGATPERLRLVGWVQDAQGQVLGAAQSACR